VFDGNVPVASGYALPVGSLVTPNGASHSCAMVYAIATLPEYRGRGFGELITEAAARLAETSGYQAVVLCPASDSLFEYYLNHTRFRVAFDVYEARITRAGLSAEALYDIRPVSPQGYRIARRRLLTGRSFIDMDENSLSFQQHLCASLGGGLYELSCSGQCMGCAVTERQSDGSVWIKELLVSGGFSAAAAASSIAAVLPAEEYLVRTPSPYDMKIMVRRRFAMMLPDGGASGSIPAENGAWFGLAFD
jgi:GNAT superfamily N-acetyltransferase